jgi:predicted naringenin-chalcone synthase
MTAAIIGLGTASPAHAITQGDAAAMAASLCGSAESEARAVAALYRRSSVRSRGSVLFANGLPDHGVRQSFFPPANSPRDRGPSTAARLDRYAADAPPLARAAASGALSEASVSPPEITHLVTVSCTGFSAPGVDAALIGELGLRPTVQRTHVGFMGCHGAINGLRVAAALAHSDRRARVLLCAVELCSLHFHYTADPDKIVANALFADGAAAAVVAASDIGVARIASTGSCLFPDSAEAMTWRIGDYGFEMTLSARVPDLLHAALPAWLSEFLAPLAITCGDVGAWAVHPGGPRVLSAVEACLHLPAAALAASRDVLSAHGNMSSPTLLFILDRLRRGGALPRPCVGLAFGPGLTAEGIVLD